MPTIVISRPTINAVVDPNGFLVQGLATDTLSHPVDSLTVQVDNGQVDQLVPTPIPSKTLSIVSFNQMSPPVQGGSDPHIVKVVATNDQGVSQTKTVAVFIGVPFQVSAPAVQLEITPALLDPSNPNDQTAIHSLVSEIQKQLIPLSKLLTGIGLTLAGPNLIVSERPHDGMVLRVGLWIVGPTFPLLSPPDLLLPVLPDPAVLAGFGTVPFLPLPPIPDPTTGGLIAIGISVPTATLQTFVGALLQELQLAVAARGVSLDSVTVTCSAPASVITSFVGELHVFPFSHFNGTITEVLGTAPVLGAQPPQMIPTIVGSSYSGSMKFFIDLISQFFISQAFTVGVAVPIVLGHIAGQVASIASRFVGSLPSSVPFRNPNSSFLPAFPMLVTNCTLFGTTNMSMLGLGTVLFQKRNQAMVAMTLSGPAVIDGFQSDLDGGAQQTYGLTWANLVPDPDKFTWGVSGTDTDTGTVTFTPAIQQASFVASFPLPLHVKPGRFPFKLTVEATETSGLDASQTLTAPPGTTNVTVVVEKDRNRNK